MKKNRATVHQYLESIRYFFTTDFGIALAIVIVWQFVMSLFGYVIDITTSSALSTGAPNLHEATGLLGHTYRWDSGWYNNVTNHFYNNSSQPASTAFYPLFPILVVIVKMLFLGHIGITTAAFLLNTVASWLAIVALIKIIRSFTKNDSTRWLILGVFIASPVAFFLHMIYGEAVFIAFGFWAYWFSLQKKWGPMAVMLAFVSASRLPALTFILLCGLQYIQSYKWNIIKAVKSWKWLWFLLSPLGLMLYGIYLYFVRGDFFAMVHAYQETDDWNYYHFTPNIFYTIGRSVKTLFDAYFSKSLDIGLLISHALPLVALAILLLASLYALFGMKKKGIPLGIFGLASFIMFTINGHLVSAHRYVLPCIVVYIALAVLAEKYAIAKYLLYPVLFASMLIQSLLIVLFINHYFVG